MKVLISGGTGMIGGALVASLLEDGHEPYVLTRSVGKAHLPPGAQALLWDGKSTRGWGDSMGQMDAVVNLVGERLSKFPWTPAQKKRFWESRVNGGHAIVEAIRSTSKRPGVLIQASGVNYYGPRGLEPVTEVDPPGSDFLAQLSQAWEASTAEVESLGVRRVIIRSAVVLNSHDGILPLMMLPVRLFAGGRFGRGSQGLPWIHQEDEIGAIRFLLERSDAMGAFNLAGPVPISSADFMRTLARLLHRPFWLPVPAFAFRLALDGMATLLVDGLYPLPERLLGLGYKFRFRTAEAALRDLVG